MVPQPENIEAEEISLVYFNGRGRTEPIRYLFAYAKVPFEDKRIELSDWEAVKKEFDLCQLPVVRVKKDGATVADENQSGAILRKYAAKYGLAGKTPDESFAADEIYESARDLKDAVDKLMWEFDMAKKAEAVGALKSGKVKLFLDYFEEKLKANGGKFIAGGDGFTYGDFAIAWIMEYLGTEEIMDYLGVHYERPVMMSCSEFGAKYPGMSSLKKSVESTPGIKAYRATRPETKF